MRSWGSRGSGRGRWTGRGGPSALATAEASPWDGRVAPSPGSRGPEVQRSVNLYSGEATSREEEPRGARTPSAGSAPRSPGRPDSSSGSTQMEAGSPALSRVAETAVSVGGRTADRTRSAHETEYRPQKARTLGSAVTPEGSVFSEISQALNFSTVFFCYLWLWGQIPEIIAKLGDVKLLTHRLPRVLSF